MTTQTKLNMIEEAQQLAERFPDLYILEVIEHIEMICNINISYDTALWRGIEAAYGGDERMAKFWLEVKE